MKYTLPILLFASPALAHSGAHMHPHSVEGWVVGLGLLAFGVATGIAIRNRGRRK